MNPHEGPCSVCEEGATPREPNPTDFAWDTYWCPSERRVVMCSGPCPDGTEHARLSFCATCSGVGRVRCHFTQVERVAPDGKIMHGHQLHGDECPTCHGERALAPPS